MRQIAIYGKGGIGKSTISSNLSMALHEIGLSVMQIGCDPKRDSTRILTDGRFIPTVLDTYREFHSKGRKDSDISLDDIVFRSNEGIYCVEAGGPKPGVGCAGRGVLTALQKLKDLNAFDTYNIDFAIYDVLGDVVCGGFAMPMREGFSREIYIVISGEFMALYAANNICEAIKTFANRSKIGLGGIICNSRNVAGEREIAEEFSRRIGSKLIYFVPRDNIVQDAEINKKTVIAYDSKSNQADVYRNMARCIRENDRFDIPKPLKMEELENLVQSYKDSFSILQIDK